MDFFDRFALHTEAVGVDSVGFAWDLAHLPISDDQHLTLASALGGWSA